MTGDFFYAMDECWNAPPVIRHGLIQKSQHGNKNYPHTIIYKFNPHKHNPKHKHKFILSHFTTSILFGRLALDLLFTCQSFISDGGESVNQTQGIFHIGDYHCNSQMTIKKIPPNGGNIIYRHRTISPRDNFQHRYCQKRHTQNESMWWLMHRLACN